VHGANVNRPGRSKFARWAGLQFLLAPVEAGQRANLLRPAGDEDQCVDWLNLMTIWSPFGDARECYAVPLSRFERLTI